MPRLSRILRLLLGAIAGAILTPIAVIALMMVLAAVQRRCWGPTDSVADSCLVGTLAGLFIFTFVSWIPGAMVGFLVALCTSGPRRSRDGAPLGAAAAPDAPSRKEQGTE